MFLISLLELVNFMEGENSFYGTFLPTVMG